MPLCQICDIPFETSLELEVHELSLSHHIKLEAVAPTSHFCPPCNIKCPSLGAYSKHVDTLEHRKRRDRMRAIIDTMDAGIEPNNGSQGSRQTQRCGGHPSSYLEPTLPFIRNGPNRRTYPALHRGLRRFNSQAHLQEELSQFPCSDHPENFRDEIYFYAQRAEMANNATHVDYDLAWNNHIPDSILPPHYEEEFRPYFMSKADSCGTDAARRGNCCEREDVSQPSGGSSRTAGQNDGKKDRNVPLLKRGLLARLSLKAKKDKGTASKNSTDNGGSEKNDRKTKKKKSKSQSPSTSSKCNAKSTASASGSVQLRRAAPLSVSMKDKTKKWELVAVKGKATYLKNRSQRLLKDRMSKYRLVDSKGMVVEDMHEDEPCTSSTAPCRPQTSKNGSTLPSLTSHIWGTGPEARSRSQQKGPSEKPLNASLAPSAIAPAAPRTPCLRGDQTIRAGNTGWNDTSSGYATMVGDLPMSTPKNYDVAVRAYENCQGLPIPDTVDSVLNEVSRKAQSLSKNADNGVNFSSSLNDSSISSVNSSLALDSHSLGSRMDLTALPNVTRISDVGVKEEPGESPPPDALPSPPQFDQTVNTCQKDAMGKIVGEKEREEFWTLGIAEMKKGHEIIEARSKIEALQKQLFDATTVLQQLEVEMNEILRRKSELLGLPPPSTFV
uniref:C2H2-type domain-containing protein n=1 Tax=Haemonchus contortus TaxID=6289 RepID=A0A7I4YM75_HAECO